MLRRFSFGFALCVGAQLFGQDFSACVTLAKLLQNERIETSNPAYHAYFYQRHCGSTSTTQSTTIGIGVPLEDIPIKVDGSGTYGSVENFCNQVQRDIKFDNKTFQRISTISEQSGPAIAVCIAAVRDGGFIGIKTLDAQALTIDIVPGRGAVMIQGFNDFNSPRLTCTGQMPGKLGDQVYRADTHFQLVQGITIFCRRDPDKSGRYAAARFAVATDKWGSYPVVLPPDEPVLMTSQILSQLASLEKVVANQPKVRYFISDIAKSNNQKNVATLSLGAMDGCSIVVVSAHTGSKTMSRGATLTMEIIEDGKTVDSDAESFKTVSIGVDGGGIGARVSNLGYVYQVRAGLKTLDFRLQSFNTEAGPNNIRVEALLVPGAAAACR